MKGTNTGGATMADLIRANKELAEALTQCRRLLKQNTDAVGELRARLAEAKSLLLLYPGGGLSAYDNERWHRRRDAFLRPADSAPAQEYVALAARWKEQAEQTRGALNEAENINAKAEKIALRLAEAERLLREWAADCYCQQDSLKHPDGCGRCADTLALLRPAVYCIKCGGTGVFIDQHNREKVCPAWVGEKP